MAWRRGFLRIWIVLTILWIGFTGWYQYAGRFQDWFVAPLVVDNECSKRLGKWPSGKEWTEWDFVVHELFPNDAPDALPLITDKNGRAVPDTRIDPEGTGIASAFERDRWRDTISQKIHECEIAREAAMPAVQRLTTRAANIWQGARGSLPLVILPPLALLAIGWLLNWIARGFQASA